MILKSIITAIHYAIHYKILETETNELQLIFNKRSFF